MADNITILDNAGNPITMRTTDAAGVHTAHHIIQSGTVTTVSTVTSLSQLGGQAITLGAGAVAGGTLRITLASDDPGVALLGTIDADTSALVVDAAAIEALLTAMDADTSALVVDLAAIEALITTIDADTGALVTDLAAIEALLTAIDADTSALVVDAAAMEVLLGTIDADTGGMLTALQVMDDWDESDRAKVNLIVGQAGISAGAGAVAANTPRVTLASDDPGIASLAVLSQAKETYSAISTAAVLSAELKASAGRLHGIQCFNLGTAAVFMRVYNQTGAPGSTDNTNIIWRGLIPPDDGGYVVPIPEGGWDCDTGIGIRVTSGVGDTDTGALAANEVLVNVQYK